jgi:hypothetical protein
MKKKITGLLIFAAMLSQSANVLAAEVEYDGYYAYYTDTVGADVNTQTTTPTNNNNGTGQTTPTGTNTNMNNTNGTYNNTAPYNNSTPTGTNNMNGYDYNNQNNSNNTNNATPNVQTNTNSNTNTNTAPATRSGAGTAANESEGVEFYGNIPANISQMDSENGQLKVDQGTYIVQDGDDLWLIMGHIKAKMDVMIYTDPDNISINEPEAMDKNSLAIPVVGGNQ